MKKKLKVPNCYELEEYESSEYSADFSENYKKFIQKLFQDNINLDKKLKCFNFFIF